jgi:hypothetical protein
MIAALFTGTGTGTCPSPGAVTVLRGHGQVWTRTGSG